MTVKKKNPKNNKNESHRHKCYHGNSFSMFSSGKVGKKRRNINIEVR